MTAESDGFQHVLECVQDRTTPEPDGKQNNTSDVWTSRNRMKADGSSKRSPLARDEVDGVVESLIEQGNIISWHGLLAPATDKHLMAILENEKLSGEPRTLLISRVNKFRQGAEGR